MRTDPYNRIMEAAARGVGVRLSPDEVLALSLDDAISSRASVISDDWNSWEDQLNRLTRER